MRNRLQITVLILLFEFMINDIYSQNFSLVTDTNNPIVTTSPPSGYSGVSWIDYNGDGNLDLFINQGLLFKNTGSGNFSAVTTAIGSGQNMATGNGNTWADYDNDGDLDVYISSSTSYLYRNDGNDTFTKINSGDIGNGAGNRGWSSAWGDYDNDGFVDLVITHPAGFVTSNSTTNHLLRNNGDGGFTKITTGDVVSGFAPYTVASWSDFDGDGDLDLSIGSGPANGNPAADYFYKNNLKETGAANLTRIISGRPATDKRDGQVWNWIDYDNDGDLDLYITNWGGNNTSQGLKNDFYKNDNGAFTKITSGNIATDNGASLASVWADFNNDGYIDCYVANERGWPDRLYTNNGDGTFTSITNTILNSSFNKHSASAGDYDNDGRVDLITIGPSSISLYHNETANNNNWVNFKLEGTTSNKAAIGAKVRIKTTILGKTFWQMREISAQNSFNSQNDLRAHFGLGDAANIDSIKVEWPSGQIDVVGNTSVNAFYEFVEGEGIKSTTDIGRTTNSLPSKILLEQNYPNPFNPTTVITFSIPEETNVNLKIFDVLGNEVKELINEQKSPGNYNINFEAQNLSSGVYFYKLTVGNNIQTKKMLLLR